MATYPYHGQEWGVCRFCSMAFPVSQMRLHHRFGWVCFGPTIWGTDCRPGLIQRDEIPIRTRPEPGRLTTAPTVNEAEGIDEYLSDQTTFYFLDQADGTTTHSLAFGEFITVANLGDWRLLNTGKPPGGWVLDDGANRLWVRNSFLEWGHANLQYSLIEKPAHIGLAVVSGSLEYTA